MASADHLALSDFIKAVHQNLRESSKEVGTEEAWQTHCSNEENLKKYAHAMKELSCKFWEQNIDSRAKSRIEWTRNTCLNYFSNDIHRFRDKEKDICAKLNETFFISVDPLNSKLRLLDVGSCYNPFNKFSCFEVTAIDIAPATNEVFKCDFLNVRLGGQLVVNNVELYELPKNHFNVLVFSLLLEYLPSPNQRLLCCTRAYDLLKYEGLLIVITPDSNHVGINAKYMKSWRFVLARIGFTRVKYEKLAHIHCMAFRKSLNKVTATRWAQLHKDKQLFDEILIPQDLNKSDKLLDNVKSKNTCVGNEDQYDRDFRELPKFGIFQ